MYVGGLERLRAREETTSAYVLAIDPSMRIALAEIRDFSCTAAESARGTRVFWTLVSTRIIMAGIRTMSAVLSRVQKAVVLLVALDVVLLKSPAPVLVTAESLCQQLISTLGYACNDYTLETGDGFVLGLYNVPYGRAGPGATRGQPVLLFHGFQAGGDNFFWNSPEESLGTVLADAGYDVWVGNNRCLQWSHGNTKYGYNDTEYWDWTWDELAAYDVANTLDFVYNERSGTKVFYVAHSQGTLSFFAALTGNPNLRAQVASQVRGAALLAPFTYNENINAPLNKLILSSYADAIPPLLGIGPVDAKKVVGLICNTSKANCENLIDGLLGKNNYVDDSRMSFYFQYFPQVTSSKNYNHFGQTHRSGQFQKYDKGFIGNLLAYGQFFPPLYDLSTFPSSIPLQIFTGGIDGLADPIDTQHLVSSLPSTVNKEGSPRQLPPFQDGLGFHSSRGPVEGIWNFEGDMTAQWPNIGGIKEFISRLGWKPTCTLYCDKGVPEGRMARVGGVQFTYATRIRLWDVYIS